MSLKTPAYLYTKFETADKPSEVDFRDLIDSMGWVKTDTPQWFKGKVYVSTDPAITNHGSITTSGAAAYCVEQGGTVLVFPPATTYEFTSTWEPDGSVVLEFEYGVTISVASGRTVDLRYCTVRGYYPAASGAGSLLLGVIPTVMYGDAPPESSIIAPVGTLFIDRSGGAGTTLYVKETGTGWTGWAAK